MNPNDAAENPNPLLPSLQGASPSIVLQTLLRRPTHLLSELQTSAAGRLTWLLLAFALLAFGAYGVVVGSFSGESQWVAAPLKIAMGGLASAAICLPSLFIFLSLSGGEVTLRGTIGTLAAALALTAFLMIGLVPVAWVFSQSTDSLAFIGAMHLLFWLIAVTFGLR